MLNAAAGAGSRADAVALLRAPVAPALAWLAVLALAVWLAMHWWTLNRPGDASPPVMPSPATDVRAAGEAAAAAALFGQPDGPAGTPSATAGDVKLKGVFAGPGAAQAAIVNTGKDDAYVPLNGEVAPGVLLKEVLPTHIVIARNGRAERVDLEPLKSGETPRAASRRAPPPREESAEAAPQPAPSASGDVAPGSTQAAAAPPVAPGAPAPIPGGAPAPIPEFGPGSPQSAPVPVFVPGPNAVPAPPVPAPQSRAKPGGEAVATRHDRPAA